MKLTLLFLDNLEAQVITRACATAQTLKPPGRQESHFPSLGDKWGMQRKANYAVHIFTIQQLCCAHLHCTHTMLCTPSLYTHYAVHIFTVHTTVCTPLVTTFQLGHSSGQVSSLLSGLSTQTPYQQSSRNSLSIVPWLPFPACPLSLQTWSSALPCLCSGPFPYLSAQIDWLIRTAAIWEDLKVAGPEPKFYFLLG